MTSALVGVNLVSVFYFLSLNVPFGLIAMVIAIITRNSESGSDCAMEAKDGVIYQEFRGQYLSLQVIPLIIYLPTCFLHILYFKIKGVEWCHEQYLASEEDED